MGALSAAEQLFDEVPCGIVVTDPRGLILKVNQTFCSWSGYARADLVGQKRLQDLFTIGGRIFHQTHWAPMLQMQGSISEVKFDLVRSDGQKLTAMLNAIRRTGEAGTVDQITMMLAEERNKYERQLVFERKRADALADLEVKGQRDLKIAEARLRQAMRIGAMHLWEVDPRGRRLYEPTVADLLGLKPQNFSASAVMRAIREEDRDAEEAALQRALREPEKVHNWTFRLRAVDGSDRVVIASGQAFYGENGRLAEFVGVLRDITETTRLRAEAEDRAVFAEQMVGIVSHDLRNPLSAMAMGASLLERGAELPPRLGRVLKSMVGAGARAKRLIEDLLDFTQARVGKGLSVGRQSVDLHEITARSVDEMRLAFPGCVLQHATEGEGACTADPDRIAQLLGNLIANAATYGRAGAPITITSSLSAGEACLSVHNDGEPIPDQLLPTLFEPMVRGVGVSETVRSVGLGLFIVRAIARAHGGEISARSCQAEGTTFTFAFQALA